MSLDNVSQHLFLPLPAVPDLPEFGAQHDEQGEELEAAQEHLDAEDALGEVGEAGEGAGGAGDAEGGANVAESGDADAEGVEGADAVESQEERPEDDGEDVEEEELPDAHQDVAADLDAVHVRADDAARAEFLVHDGPGVLGEQDDARDLDAAGRRPGAAAADHEHHQDALREGRPLVEVSGDEASRRERADLEARVAEGLDGLHAHRIDEVHGNQQHGRRENHEVGLELRVVSQHARSLFPDAVIEAEVAAREDHEEGHPALERGVIEVHGVVVVERETARAERAHRVRDGVEEVEAAEEVDDASRHREDHVHEEERARHLAQARQHAVARRARRLSVVHVDGALSGLRQERDEDDDDAEAAEPVRHHAPEQDAERL